MTQVQALANFVANKLRGCRKPLDRPHTLFVVALDYH